jgi:hypothetical protein
MKKILFGQLLLSLLFASNIRAQNYLHVHKNDGTKESFLLNDLNCLRFKGVEEIQVVPKSTPWVSLATAEISVITIGEKDISVKSENQILSNGDIIVYPNPTGGILNIESSENILDLILYDMNGNRIFQKYSLNTKLFSFNLSSVSRGTYLLQVRTAEGMVNKKVVKN